MLRILNIALQAKPLKNTIYKSIQDKKAAKKKMLAVLIDPDKAKTKFLADLCEKAEKANVDFILIGGSLMTDGDIKRTVKQVKQQTSIPTLLFPGSAMQITDEADGILFLSLLSSRNPEMLIGQQVVAAPYIKKTKLEVISTAYLLIDSGVQTTASYMSNSNPIPANKSEIAASTALAGEYMGMDLIYLDGGSGAKFPVPENVIKKVSNYSSKPIVVGGGLDTSEKVEAAFDSGADIVVIGNALEKDPNFLNEIAEIIQKD